MKAKTFHEVIPSLPIDIFKHQNVLVFDLTSMQGATENCQYPELVRQPLKLEKNFTYPLEHFTELIVLGERMSSIVVVEFGAVGKKSKTDIVSFQQIFNRIPLLNHWYFCSFPSHYVPTLNNDFFAITNRQTQRYRVGIG